jgi:hypothetical protein
VQDNDEVNYDLARKLFLARTPQHTQGEAPTAAELDEEVRVLISVGRYTLDRWGAEFDAEKRNLKGAALRKARECCSGLHFDAIQNEAIAKLRDYLRRNGDVVDLGHLNEGLGQFASDLSRRLKPRLSWAGGVEWLAVEFLRVVVGVVALLMIAGALSIFSASFRREAAHQVDTLLLGAPANETPPQSAAPPANRS